MRWTRQRRQTSGADPPSLKLRRTGTRPVEAFGVDGRGRRSRVVLTPRRRRQVRGEFIRASDGDKKARSPGRARRKPLKPSRRECRVNPARPAVTMLVCFFISHARLRVRAAHPAFPAPSIGAAGLGTTRAFCAAGLQTCGRVDVGSPTYPDKMVAAAQRLLPDRNTE
jgi:hypothetical protein